MELTKSGHTIPTIDLAPFRLGDAGDQAEVTRAVDNACRTVGFLIVTGHGVDPLLVEQMRDVTTRFYGLPLEEKMRSKMPPDAYRGYLQQGTQSLAASYGVKAPPDIKESFAIGPIDVPSDPYFTDAPGGFFAPNIWPDQPTELKQVWLDYYREMERLSADLMRLFALALGLPKGFFDDKIDRHITDLSAIHYPPLELAPEPGQLRGGAHTDFGSLTVVQRDQAPGGLQILLDEEWIDAPYVPNSFVVNIGDLMAEWTNDTWISTIHRVGLPTDLKDLLSDRLTLAFFHQPNYDAPIEVLPTCVSADRPAQYEPTTSGQHFLNKLSKLTEERDLESA